MVLFNHQYYEIQGKIPVKKSHVIRKIFLIKKKNSRKLLTHLSTKNVDLSKF